MGKTRNTAMEVPGKKERFQISPAAFVLVVGFFALLVVGVYLEKLMSLLLAIYVIMSAIVFVLYARDKSAAKSARWRVSEGRLLWMGVIGGWPGALLAQQMFRHKTRKRSFQIQFWLTVVLNLGLLWCQTHPAQTFAILQQWLR